MINYYFAGAITPTGFVNFFNKIPECEKEKLIIIKGTAGSGKSTIMKKIADKFKNSCEVACYKCFSAPNSLDAIRIAEKKLVIVDGTSPHIMEALRANDTIFNLFEFIDNKKLLNYTFEINEINDNIVSTKKLLYNYIISASHLKNNIDKNIFDCCKKFEFDKFKNEIVTTLNPDIGRIEKLFLSNILIDSQNLVELNDNFKKHCIFFESKHNVLSQFIITEIASEIEQKNLQAQLFYNWLNPDKVEHIYHNKNFFTCKPQKTYKQKINIDHLIDLEKYKKIEHIVESDVELLHSLLVRASIFADATNHLHDELEKLYYPAINFDQLNLATEKLLESIDRI